MSSEPRYLRQLSYGRQEQLNEFEVNTYFLKDIQVLLHSQWRYDLKRYFMSGLSGHVYLTWRNRDSSVSL